MRLRLADFIIISSKGLCSMSNQGVDPSRRRFLTLTTTVVGGAGAAAAVWPFLASLKPSERAKALGAPITIDVSQHRRRPTHHRRLARQAGLGRQAHAGNAGLACPRSPAAARPGKRRRKQQPDYVKGEARAIKPEMLVMVGSCTHLGCSPVFRPDHPARGCRRQLGGRFLLPLPRLQVRPLRPRLQGRARSAEPGRAAASL